MDERLQISYSSLSTFSSCPRKFELRKMYYNVFRDDQIPASVGKAIHASIQDYIVYKDVDKAIFVLMQEYPIELCWSPTDDRSLEASINSVLHAIETPEFAMQECVRIKTSDGVIVPAIEVPFEIELENFELTDGRKVSLVGYMDTILHTPYQNSGYKVWDVKTHRNNKWDLTSKYKFDAQQVPYGIVLEHILGHQVQEFEVNYLSMYIDILQPRTEVYSFMKTEAHVENWLVGLLTQLYNLKKFIEIGLFPRTQTGCEFYNRACGNLDICEETNPEIIQRYLLGGKAKHEVEPPRRVEPWITCQLELPNFSFGG